MAPYRYARSPHIFPRILPVLIALYGYTGGAFSSLTLKLGLFLRLHGVQHSRPVLAYQPPTVPGFSCADVSPATPWPLLRPQSLTRQAARLDVIAVLHFFHPHRLELQDRLGYVSYSPLCEGMCTRTTLMFKGSYFKRHFQPHLIATLASIHERAPPRMFPVAIQSPSICAPS